MAPSHLLVDIGNHALKVAVWDGQASSPGLTLDAKRFPLEASLDKIGLPANPMTWWIASVHSQVHGQLVRSIGQARQDDQIHTVRAAQLKLEMDVNRDQVGVDRVLAGLAASHSAGGQAAIVVDAGTAITVDLITAEPRFTGGAILCGPGLAAWALSQGTDALPDLGIQLTFPPPPLIGNDTHTALQSGIHWGTLGAVRELVSGMLRAEPQAEVFFTGGGGRVLSEQLEWGGRYDADLVLRGLSLAALDISRFSKP